MGLQCCTQAFSSCSLQASHCDGFSYGAQALGTQASVTAACRLRSCRSRALESWFSSVVHGLSCSVASGILLDQGSNPCPLHWPSLNHWTTREAPSCVCLECPPDMTAGSPHSSSGERRVWNRSLILEVMPITALFPWSHSPALLADNRGLLTGVHIGRLATPGTFPISNSHLSPIPFIILKFSVSKLATSFMYRNIHFSIHPGPLYISLPGL